MSTKMETAIVKGEYGDSFNLGKRVALKAINKIEDLKPKVAVTFISPKYNYKEVIKGIKEVVGNDTIVIGCSSAGEFNEEELMYESIVCGLIASDSLDFHVTKGIDVKSDAFKCIQAAAADIPVSSYPYRTVLILSGGLISNGEEVALSAFNLFKAHNIVGGAAADDLRFKETHVFFNDEVITNGVVALVVDSNEKLAVSYAHGFSPISLPLKLLSQLIILFMKWRIKKLLRYLRSIQK
jgi:methyl-accepting chemotaxis protein